MYKCSKCGVIKTVTKVSGRTVCGYCGRPLGESKDEHKDSTHLQMTEEIMDELLRFTQDLSLEIITRLKYIYKIQKRFGMLQDPECFTWWQNQLVGSGIEFARLDQIPKLLNEYTQNRMMRNTLMPQGMRAAGFGDNFNADTFTSHSKIEKEYPLIYKYAHD